MLIVVATPIGNLADCAPRVLEVLSTVDFLLCEDTRKTGLLLSSLGVKGAPLSRLHAHNEHHRLKSLVERMVGGETAALVSDAGTPIISDPGGQLVSACHLSGVRVSCVAGPSALTAALSVAGFPAPPIHFLGFPPRKSGARLSWLRNASRLKGAFVLFESGQRIHSLVTSLQALFPNREVCACREMTKEHEEIIRCRISDFRPQEIRGEFVLVIGPGEPIYEPKEQISGLKGIAGLLAEHWGMSKREAYNQLLTIRPQNESSFPTEK